MTGVQKCDLPIYYKDLIFQGKTLKEREKAKQEKKTAILFGFKNGYQIEDEMS